MRWEVGRLAEPLDWELPRGNEAAREVRWKCPSMPCSLSKVWSLVKEIRGQNGPLEEFLSSINCPL